ncbi:glycerol-3-phosphate 1-O-acyltransferase PlsY [Butyrivibrio sp. YAB3001]|uniref:glycerol-3-phosphate 1-O-acyltransferase PlsY n=1 Tax=Butyrivibrio sp. YAB3001 TaxID=1520812 RepID=UPI0008F67F1D|nr:glycerol-3-phosphate 1-O-acyltransferase PlsY [Butyrivibrio sp. YAB3001]SFB68488.1 glycerol-3-phosphate acyltransferase PlsY [Butyrivibrio sp. YAB3001]
MGLNNLLVVRVICIIVGYCFGMIQTAVFYGRLKGVDIRKVGSGNAGTTNTLRVLGTKAGFIVLFGDMFKCILAILLTGFLFKGILGQDVYDQYKWLLKIYTAAGCVLGHDFPFFLKFKGGKGIAVTSGYIIAMHWTFVIVGMASFLIPFNITHFVSLGSLCLYSCFFLQLVICGQLGFLGMDIMSQGTLIEMYVVAFLMTVLAFYQHRGNIKKLLSGTERKTYLFKKNKID